MILFVKNAKNASHTKGHTSRLTFCTTPQVLEVLVKGLDAGSLLARCRCAEVRLSEHVVLHDWELPETRREQRVAWGGTQLRRRTCAKHTRVADLTAAHVASTAEAHACEAL